MKAGGVNGAKLIGKAWDDQDVHAKGLVVKAGGHTITDLSASELKRWTAKLSVMRSDWVKKANHNGQALLNDLLTRLKQGS